MLTKNQKQICEKYSARGENGLVRCVECPLVIDHHSCSCKAYMHYDRHEREWIKDEEVQSNDQ